MTVKKRKNLQKMEDEEIRTDIKTVEGEIDVVVTEVRGLEDQIEKLRERVNKGHKTLAKRGSSHFRPETGYPCWIKGEATRHGSTSFYWAEKVLNRTEEENKQWITTYYVHGKQLEVESSRWRQLLYRKDGNLLEAEKGITTIKLKLVESAKCKRVEEASELAVMLDHGISVKNLIDLQPNVLHVLTPEGAFKAVGMLREL